MATAYYVKDTIIRIDANGSSKDYKLSEGEDSTGTKYPIKLFCIDNAEYYTTNCSTIFTYDQYTSDLEYTYTYDGSTYTFSGPYSVCKLDSSVTSDSVIISGSTYSSNNGVITTQYPIYAVNFGFNEYDDGAISPLSSCSGTLVIGKNVKVLSYWAFSNCAGFETVIINDDLQILDAGCFNNCSGLTKVNYIGTLNGWASMLFAGMLSNPTYYANNLYIKDVLIGDTLNFTNISAINPYTFVNCTGVKTITMGSTVTTIGEGSFEHCEGLTDLTIGTGVTKIGSSAFSYCTSLNTITIPDNVETIGSYAFYKCGSDTVVTIGKGVTTINGYAFDGYTGDVTLYYNATSVSDFSMSTRRFSRVKIVTVGSNVTDIPANFLNYLSITSSVNIKSVTFETGSVCNSFGEHAFASCATVTSMTLPFVGTGKNASYGNALFGAIFYATTDLSSYSSIETLCTDYDYLKITQYYSSSSSDNVVYYIPSSITNVTILGGTIKYGAFYNCSMLTDITLKSGVTSIGDCACYSCTSLSSISIPSSVTSIGTQAFMNCTSLSSISIPSSVTSIGECALCDCSILASISVDSSNNYYQSIDGSLYNKSGTQLIQYAINRSVITFTVPDGVTSIANYAFYDCMRLVNVTIPSSATSIGDYAFYGCAVITTMSWQIDGSKSATTGDYAFSSLTQLPYLSVNCTTSQFKSTVTYNSSSWPTRQAFYIKCTDGTIYPMYDPWD